MNSTAGLVKIWGVNDITRGVKNIDSAMDRILTFLEFEITKVMV